MFRFFHVAWGFVLNQNNKTNRAAVTQLDRVPGYEPGSQEFESLQPRQV